MLRLRGVEQDRRQMLRRLVLHLDGVLARPLGQDLGDDFGKVQQLRARRRGLEVMNGVREYQVALVYHLLEFAGLRASSRLRVRQCDLEVVGDALDRAKRLPQLVRDMAHHVGGFVKYAIALGNGGGSCGGVWHRSDDSYKL